MTKKERVLAAIEFRSPDRIPSLAFTRDQQKADILNYPLFPVDNQGELNKSEWGYVWHNLGDGTMGQPKKPPLDNWSLLNEYKFPDVGSAARFDGVDEFMRHSDNHFLNVDLGISGFSTYLFLRGFINSMLDFQSGDKKALKLLDDIFEIERIVIKQSAGYGFDGVLFLDDWGTQKGLMVSPNMWIEVFKPFYKKQFDFVHELKLKVFFHSCGDITSIVPELHEIGADVIDLSQPNVLDIDKISSRLKGKQCFMAPISYQTISLSGTKQDIFKEAEYLYKKLGDKRGGFIAHLEDYSVLGMTEENYKACWESFRRIGN